MCTSAQYNVDTVNLSFHIHSEKMTAIFPEFLSYIARLYDKEIIETP